MMVMTAKVNFRKILVALVAIAGITVALILLLGGGKDAPAAETAAGAVSNNDARVEFLESFGWDVNASPSHSSQVLIPQESTQVFDRYNDLQKSQGYDLDPFAGKTVMRYVYKVNNYPGATEPVFATLLVYQNQVIGGDITDTAAGGRVQGFQKIQTPPEASEGTAESVPESLT